MPLNLLTLSASEAERLAYSGGFTGIAELLARLSDAECTLAHYREALEAIAHGGRNGTMNARQCAGAAEEVLK